jgi:hypothetical protein
MDTLRIPDLGSRRIEVGCGYRARAAKGARVYVGIDVHQPYLAEAHRRYPSRLFMLSDWSMVLQMFEDRTFLGLYAIDFIEHLGRREGRRFLKDAIRVAERVAIFTPYGPMPQVPQDGEPESQRHRSAWTPSDFDGWEVEILPGFHGQLADGTPLEQPISAFWAISR